MPIHDTANGHVGAEPIDRALEQAANPLSREEVAAIVTEIVGTMDGDLSAGDIKVYAELEGLAQYIRSARAEIAAIRPSEIQSRDIPTATDELDAVVGATEKATGEILDAAEQIQTIAEGLPDAEARDQLVALVTGIFEASNFQDITGQRITKVVKTLKHIEARIDTLVEAMGDEVDHTAPADAEAPAPAPDDAELLNGPQMPDSAIDQDEIDRLLAQFD
jgi:chemotaxis protein CheZ